MSNVQHRTIGPKAQIDSPFELSMPDNITEVQLGISRSAVPTVGSMTVQGKVKGAIEFGDIIGTIDLTADPLNPQLFSGSYETLKFTTVGLDADKTINVIAAGW